MTDPCIVYNYQFNTVHYHVMNLLFLNFLRLSPPHKLYAWLILTLQDKWLVRLRQYNFIEKFSYPVPNPGRLIFDSTFHGGNNPHFPRLQQWLSHSVREHTNFICCYQFKLDNLCRQLEERPQPKSTSLKGFLSCLCTAEDCVGSCLLTVLTSTDSI